jgi:DNA (cytosine-5)-methyltransferase 1
MAAIDLYSGMGGWSLGFKMAGIPVVSSYEWWKDANQTHNKNFSTDHKEINIRTLSLSDLPDKANIDYVVGSPPCTQFSFANRGGKGDIADGLVDIRKFLEIIEYMQPTYWAMENVPRVASIIEKELEEKGTLHQFKYLFGNIKVYTASDFGVPQDRKRMIAGNFPFDLLDSYSQVAQKLTLGDVLHAFTQNPIVDPIYGLQLNREDLTDHVFEPNLSKEEERINREAKMHHPVYNVMSFPDRQNRPSRTITALCTRVSRESIVIRDEQGNLRRLTVRERACIQSFPINFQFFSKSYAGKLKMIGNAVPPLLTFYIAQSMLRIPVASLLAPTAVQDKLLSLTGNGSTSHNPDNEGSSFSWNRSFWMAIHELRFGSGVRFELKNSSNKDTKRTNWRVNFFYGNSKNIKKKELDHDLLKRALKITEIIKDDKFMHILDVFLDQIRSVNEKELQENWTNKDRLKLGPIYLIDQLASFAGELKRCLTVQTMMSLTFINTFISEEFNNGSDKNPDLKKLTENSIGIFVGICIGCCFNSIMEGHPVKLKKNKIRA